MGKVYGDKIWETSAVKQLGRVGSIYHYNIQILAIEIHKVYSNVSQVIFSHSNKRSNALITRKLV